MNCEHNTNDFSSQINCYISRWLIWITKWVLFSDYFWLLLWLPCSAVLSYWYCASSSLLHISQIKTLAIYCSGTEVNLYIGFVASCIIIDFCTTQTSHSTVISCFAHNINHLLWNTYIFYSSQSYVVNEMYAYHYMVYLSLSKFDYKHLCVI